MDWLDRGVVVRIGGPTNTRVPGCRAPSAAPPVSRERIAHRFQDARRRGAEGVVLCGGEPTLRKDLFRLLAQARRMGFAVGLVTNGRTLTYEKLRSRLLREGPAYLRVGIHAKV